MRIAVLADIHGNIRALDAVLRDLERRSADLVVNLGDCLSGPLEARETAERLMALGGLTIRGNHDRWLTELEPDAMGRTDQAAFAQLSAPHLDWLRTLPPTATIETDVFLCHATPADDTRYFTENVTPHGVVPRPEAEMRRDLGPHMEPLALCGHTHLPRLIRLGDGRTIFNPGSVGQPAYSDTLPFPHLMEVGSPHARYGIIERSHAGWRFEHHAVTYNWDAAAATAAKAGRPDWAHALKTGFARA